MIEITARQVPEKVQPHIRTGMRFEVLETETDAEGRQTAVVAHPTRKGRTLRVSQLRFRWRNVKPSDMREEKLKMLHYHGAQHIKETFTVDEQLQIAITPLIINHIAWRYALAAAELAAAYRVAELKKLTRTVRTVHEEYERTMRKDMPSISFEGMSRQTEQFMQEHYTDFKIFEMTVDTELKKRCPGLDNYDLRTMALVSVMILRHGLRHNMEMDALVRRRLGSCKETITQPWMRALRVCMEAMAGETEGFDYREYNVELCRRIFSNNIKAIDYQI